MSSKSLPCDPRQEKMHVIMKLHQQKFRANINTFPFVAILVYLKSGYKDHSNDTVALFEEIGQATTYICNQQHPIE